MPTVIFIDPRGREVPERVTGAISADEMIGKLRAVERARWRPGCREQRGRGRARLRRPLVTGERYRIW